MTEEMKPETKDRTIRKLNDVWPLVKTTTELGLGLRILELHHPRATAKALTPDKYLPYIPVLFKNIMTIY